MFIKAKDGLDDCLGEISPPEHIEILHLYSSMVWASYPNSMWRALVHMENFVGSSDVYNALSKML
jgi:hypothetical protein